MEDDHKLAQTLVVLGLDPSRENLDRFIELGVGGISPRWDQHGLAAHRRLVSYVQQRSPVSMLFGADLEFGADGPLGREDGTEFPNQLAVAATRDPRWARRMALVAAESGRAAGLNWSFSPVADLVINFRSTITGTRSFGDDPALVARLVAAYVRALQSRGMAACAKHWPGDGSDDWDQHLVTTINNLDMDEWEAMFGKVFRAAIRAGVLTVMSAHIALTAFPGAGRIPASVSRHLNIELLRGHLGFNGLIVSNSTTMAGIGSLAHRREFLPRMLEAGCDMILFPRDVELDLGYLRAGLHEGRLSRRRLHEAVLRILALKAALGLHRPRRPLAALSRSRKRQHEIWAAACAREVVTLVGDDQHLLPLDPKRNGRLLLVEQLPRPFSLGWSSRSSIVRRLQHAGFHVERFTAHTEVHRDYFDVVLYVVAEESFLARGTIELRWDELHDGLSRCLERFWHDVPTVFVSFGWPFHVREVPACPTFVNAYSSVPAMQQAVVDALAGKRPFRGRSPVNLRPFLRESGVL